MKILSRFFNRLLNKKPSPVKPLKPISTPVRRKRYPMLHVKSGGLVDQMRDQYAQELAREHVLELWQPARKEHV
jgi:hypothetical protein